jgi:hypothetical protein
MKLSFRGCLLSALLLGDAAASIISSSDARLPMSLSSVISDLEAEGCTSLTTACLITSRSVTMKERESLHQILTGETSKSKAVGTDGGLAIAQPETLEVAETALACDGTLLYYPTSTDLSRGEGLFDDLAPAMEKIIAAASDGNPQANLLVIVPDGSSATIQRQLETAAENVLSNLVTNGKPVAVLQDVFAKVLYASAAEASSVLQTQIAKSTTPDAAMALVATVVGAESSLWPGASSIVSMGSPAMNADDLAAARILGPAAREILSSTVELVQNEYQGNTKFEPGFGSLCDAVIQRASDTLEQEASDAPSILSSSLGKQIRANLQSQLSAELNDFFVIQLKLLEALCFDEYKKGLSKLIISPKLDSDMEQVVKKSVAAFAKSAKQLVASQAQGWTAQPAKDAYAKRLKTHAFNRLLSARAGGQFKPLPRKGVTVGFHWLLPKPFGNDFRQEPWMVHATDNMVYVPKDKITDISAEEVLAGDWRDKVVPSPVGNDMLYMQ